MLSPIIRHRWQLKHHRTCRTTVSGRQCCYSAASAFRQPSTTCSISLLSQHLRPPCLFSRRPHSLEFSPDFIRDPTISAECFRRSLKIIIIIIINEFHRDASLTKTSGPLCVTCFTSVNGAVAVAVI